LSGGHPATSKASSRAEAGFIGSVSAVRRGIGRSGVLDLRGFLFGVACWAGGIATFALALAYDSDLNRERRRREAARPR